MSKNLVMVAMSGGVDSSVAAMLLKEQGMEVIGISMRTDDSLGPAEPDPSAAKSCYPSKDIDDARGVCQQLDIPFYPMDFSGEFRERVIEYFGKEYAQGRTPNPCVACNDHLKFTALLKQARQFGAYYLATGHYALKNRDRYGKYHLLRAKDRARDQTYFLFSLGQGELEHTLFPIGKYTKEDVRGFARSAGFKTAESPEKNEVVLGSRESLLMNGLTANNVRWINRDMAEAGMVVEVKTGYRHPGAKAYLWIITETTVRIDFIEPEGSVPPGQTAVFYHGDEVLGGGWIEKGIV